MRIPIAFFPLFGIASSHSRFKSNKLLMSMSIRTTSTSIAGTSIAASTTTSYIDFDCNILHEDLFSNIDTIIANANAVGVTRFVVPGCSLGESSKALDLALSNPSRFLATAGVHPYNSEDDALTEQSRAILELLVDRKECLAVGECGLDYSDGFPNKEVQLGWFRFQVGLAVKRQLPLYLHVRDAKEDFLTVMNEFGFTAGAAPPVPCCVHCFTGDSEELQSYVDMGFYIGFTGYVINQNRDDNIGRLEKWLEMVPKDRLVIETDAPYMSFKNCRKNEKEDKKKKYPNPPSALPFLAEAIVGAGGGTIDEVAEYTSSNVFKFFNIAQPSV